MLRTQVLKDAADFVKIWDELEHLRVDCGLEADVTLSPLHFLAGTSGARRSCAVACWDGLRLRGVMYATAHYAFGINTGYGVSGNFSGRGALLCRVGEEWEVVEAAVGAIFAAGIHSLHLRLSPRMDRMIRFKGLAVKYLDSRVPGDQMTLEGSFDDFLSTLGKHTRRNLRYYTRKAAAAGMVFDPEVSDQEYREALVRLNRSSAFSLKAMRVELDERLMTLHGGGCRMGLRAPGGALVAVLCGFQRAETYHLLTQVNDRRYPTLSLSLVLRGYMAQHLIAAGRRQLQFMGGTSLTLGRFCIPQTYLSLFVDRRRGPIAVMKRVCSRITATLRRNEEIVRRCGLGRSESLEQLCGGFLDTQQLSDRTVLKAAAVRLREEEHAIEMALRIQLAEGGRFLPGEAERR